MLDKTLPAATLRVHLRRTQVRDKLVNVIVAPELLVRRSCTTRAAVISMENNASPITGALGAGKFGSMLTNFVLTTV
jgi:hypothetical protein